MAKRNRVKKVMMSKTINGIQSSSAIGHVRKKDINKHKNAQKGNSIKLKHKMAQKEIDNKKLRVENQVLKFERDLLMGEIMEEWKVGDP